MQCSGEWMEVISAVTSTDQFFQAIFVAARGLRGLRVHHRHSHRAISPWRRGKSHLISRYPYQRSTPHFIVAV